MAASVKGLYYPFIHFQSLDWLKAALLYWEGVKRIVPTADYHLDDPPEIRDLVRDRLVDNVIASAHRQRAADLFMPKLQALTASRGGRIEGTLDHMGRTGHDEHVHLEKMDVRLFQRLHDAGLASSHGEWYAMEPAVAGLYMMALAGEVSRVTNTTMVTDTFDCEVASLYFNTPDGTVTAARDGLAFVRLLCPFPRPERLADVSLSTVLRLRDDHAAERRRFRDEIQNLATDAAALNDAGALKDFVQDRSARITDALRAQREALDEKAVTSTWDLLSISVPTLITGTAAALGAPASSVAVLGGMVLSAGLVNWFAKRRGAMRSTTDACPWHYLLSVDAVLKHDPRGDFGSAMQALVYD